MSIKKIIAILSITLIFFSGILTTSFANDLEVISEFKQGDTIPLSLKSNIAKLVISETLGPGDEVSSLIKFKNPSSKPIQVTISDIESLSNSKDSERFLKAIELEIQEGGGTIYKGSFQKITTPVINYINLNPKEEKEVRIFHRLPKDLDNSYQGSSLKTNWIFIARADVPEDVHTQEGAPLAQTEQNQPPVNSSGESPALQKKQEIIIRSFIDFSLNKFKDSDMMMLYLFRNGIKVEGVEPIKLKKTEDITEVRFKFSEYLNTDFFEVQAQPMKKGSVLGEFFLPSQVLTEKALLSPDKVKKLQVKGYLEEEQAKKEGEVTLYRNGEKMPNPITPPKGKTGLVSFSTAGKITDDFEVKAVSSDGEEEVLRNSTVFYADIEEESTPAGSVSGAEYSLEEEDEGTSYAEEGSVESSSFSEKVYNGEIVKTSDFEKNYFSEILGSVLFILLSLFTFLAFLREKFLKNKKKDCK